MSRRVLRVRADVLVAVDLDRRAARQHPTGQRRAHRLRLRSQPGPPVVVEERCHVAVRHRVTARRQADKERRDAEQDGDAGFVELGELEQRHVGR